MGVDKELFVTKVWPTLKLYAGKDDPPQLLFMNLKNLPIALQHLAGADLRNHVVPLICRGLEKPNISIQTESLKQLTVATEKNLLEFRELRNTILPKICSICTLTVKNPKIVGLRINAMMTLSKIFKNFDSDTIKDT